VITAIAAIHVTASSGFFAVPSAAGQAHQQVAGLLPGRDQGEPAGAQVPQPRPRLVRALGKIAFQPQRQLPDQVRVPVVGLAERVVVGFPRPVHGHRLHAHEPVAGGVGQAHQRLPPVPGRLARHRQPREPRFRSPFRAPARQPAQPVCLRGHDLAGQDPALVVHHGRDLLVPAQVDREYCPVVLHDLPQRLQFPVTVPVTARQSVTLSHERAPAVLGSEARHRIRRTFFIATRRSQQVLTTQNQDLGVLRRRRPG
jgi:hypothetical protein